MKRPVIINLCLAALAIRSALATLLRSASAQDERRREAVEPRIIGGTTAALGEFPYFVQWDGCGATLIYEDILLSAAHCSGVKTNGVLVGAHKSFDSQEAGGVAQFRTITARVVHPQFDSSKQIFDFMILQLDRPVSSNTITPVVLNRNSNDPITDDALTVIGFGYTKSGNSYSTPTILNKVSVNYVNPQTCNSNYAGKINSTLSFCAGVSTGGKDSCQGDSGGPIINSRGVQVGVTSSGAGCGLAKYPGLYARVSTVADWINQQICALSANPPSSCVGIVGKAPTPAPLPAPAPTATTTSIRLDLMYDSDPSETSWSVILNSSNKKVLSSTNGKSNTLTRSYFQLPSDSYTLQLADSGADGFCCGYGVGYYGIYAVVNGAYVTLAQGSGRFQSRLSVNFSIPNSSNAPPTPAPLNPTPAPVQPTPAPVQPTPAPVQPTPAPVQPTPAPVQPTPAPVQPTPSPVQPTIAPVLPTPPPVLPTPAPLPQTGTIAPISTSAPFGSSSSTPPPIQTNPFPFSVAPAPPTPTPVAPTRAPSPTQSTRCIDSVTGRFPYSGTVGGSYQVGVQVCSWLSTRPPWIDVLCHPGQAAYSMCPKTCGQCGDPCKGLDSPTATFPIYGVVRNCAWLKIRSYLWSQQCKNAAIYAACKESCGSC